MADILIIGRGLAGAILSLELQGRGIEHDILDQPQLSSSSKVAAGVVNPLVLKRLKIVHEAQAFLAEAHPFYEQWETRWQKSFYRKVSLRHIMHDVRELNDWMEKSARPSHEPFLGKIEKNNYKDLNAPSGLGQVHHCGWMDTQLFLDLHAQMLPQHVGLKQQTVESDSLAELKARYKQVIIANGHLTQQLRPETREYFSTTRGELLIIEAPGLPEQDIIHGPVFILPIGHGQYKVGATYHWDLMEDKGSPEGKQQLVEKLESIYTGPYRIVEHIAGVRPNVKDRKPLMGQLEEGLYLFNGLGSRGVLMAPRLARLFTDFLLDGNPIPEAYQLKRFTST